METTLDTLARCRRLALAAMERVDTRAAPPAGPVATAAATAPAEYDEEQLLAGFSPRERARIVAVLDRLPPGKLFVASQLGGCR